MFLLRTAVVHGARLVPAGAPDLHPGRGSSSSRWWGHRFVGEWISTGLGPRVPNKPHATARGPPDSRTQTLSPPIQETPFRIRREPSFGHPLRHL